MAANVELWMPFKDVHQLTLSIPIVTCHRFSVHPFAWLRYVAFTIYGTEGHISSSPGGDEVDYYQATDIAPGAYYYVPEGPCFLLDPKLMDDRTSSRSDITTGQRDFRNRVHARDGKCVMVGTAVAEACHLVPHAKKHQYMRNLMSHRHEVLDPPLDDINDTRNGIMLSSPIQNAFGASRVAFLNTPNFAMTVNDVDLVSQPTINHISFDIHPSVADKRLTLQHFTIGDDYNVQHMAPHNSDAKIADSDDWPPPVIFDVTYGCAALATWGVPAFVEFAQECTKDAHYNGADHLDDHDGAAKQAEARVVESTEGDQAGDIHDVILSLWMRNAERHLQAHSVEADSPGVGERVREWLESVE